MQYSRFKLHAWCSLGLPKQKCTKKAHVFSALLINASSTSYRYAGNYKPDGRQFIVVCGNINYESVGTFLADFFHPARDDVDVEVVFLNKAEPDLEFEGLLKREHTRVQYFQ